MKKNRRGKLFASIMVIALISGLLITTADAIAPGMTASNPGTVNNSSLPGSMEYGQIATAKNVSDSTSTKFGDGANGQFSVILSAISRSYEGEQLITDAGIIFKDTFKDDYAFVASDLEMKIYTDGVEKTALRVDNKYIYAEYFGTAEPKNLVKATFDTVAKTVEYSIGESCLSYTSGSSSTSTPSSLEFGVRLRESVATPGTYNTNLTDSCTAEFNALSSNSYYHQNSEESTYSNVTRLPINVWGCAGFFAPYTINEFNEIRLQLESGTGADLTKYYQFMKSGGHAHINNTPDTDLSDEQYWFGISLDAGIYNGGLRPMQPSNILNNDIIEVPAPGFDFIVHLDLVNRTTENFDNTGTINKLTLLPTPEFIIITRPNEVGNTCSVDIGGVTYTGPCTSRDDASHWSFTSEEGYLITLLDEYDLKVIYQQGFWKNTTRDDYVKHILDAYGHVTLSQPFVVPTGSLKVIKSVTSAPGITPPANESFAVTVTFTAGQYGIGGISGPIQARTVSADGRVITYNLALLAGQNAAAIFTNIPETTTYVVTEILTDAQTNLLAEEGQSQWVGPLAASSFLSGGIAANTTATATLINDYAVVAGDTDKPEEEEKGVLEETEKLPTTGGVSASTLLGIFGLAVIAVGGTTFIINRKKFLS